MLKKSVTRSTGDQDVLRRSIRDPYEIYMRSIGDHQEIYMSSNIYKTTSLSKKLRNVNVPTCGIISILKHNQLCALIPSDKTH